MNRAARHDDGAATRALAASVSNASRFDEVVTECLPAVFGYLALRVGADEAEDLAAEAFATAFRHRERFDPALGTARAWVTGIATNLVRGHYRSERRRRHAMARGEVQTRQSFVDDVVEHVDASRRLQTVLGLLATFPADQRNAVYLVVAGLSFDEAAVALKVPTGTVQSRVARARARLREGLRGPGRPGPHESSGPGCTWEGAETVDRH
jgi:RNA polymerase sigma-70 factor (ECF subfamily)